MTSDEIRRAFLAFFEDKGHLALPSSPLIPYGDPTLLLTSAGMVQFKPYFMGEAAPPRPCLTTAQKCFRTTDIDSVGNERNLTFFEMLGNFSVGDYFKKEAIAFAWEFSTQRLKLPPDRISISIYPDDEEALSYWRDDIGIPAERIVRLDDNWWGPAGKTGPCGPDSELHYDRGAHLGCGRPTCAPGCDCPRFLEFWNLVFMQYYQDEEGHRTPLPRQNIDTGAGLERLAMLLQDASTVYETDLFRPILARAEALIGKAYGHDPQADFSLRLIADHSRAVTFLIADGVLPSNEGRGYILRRILRRAVRHGRLLGRQEPFMVEAARTVVSLMGQAYPELRDRHDFIQRVIATEEAKFDLTLQLGLGVLDETIQHLEAQGQRIVPGEVAFRLYDTYGFPTELTAEVAAERGMRVDEAGFEAAMARQRETARAAHRFGLARPEGTAPYQQLDLGETAFLGYETTAAESIVLGLIREGQVVERAEAGQEVEVMLRETPFYAEAGGQVGDTGEIIGEAGRLRIEDTQQPLPGLFAHRGRVVEGAIRVGDWVKAQVDAERRLDIARNHTATHLLHQALRDILGRHAQQSGSLVAPDRLRFDFTHLSPLRNEELAEIAQAVNESIRADLAVTTSRSTFSEAMRAGALAFFGEKYGENVRLVRVGDYSRELCGGTHLRTTGQIGYFLIVGESGIGAGLRRIEAITGRGAEAFVRSRLELLNRFAAQLGGGDLEGKLRLLQTELEEKHRQAAALLREAGRREVERLLAAAQEVNGIRVVAGQVSLPTREALLELGDMVRERLGSGVIVLGSTIEGKPALVSMVTPDLPLHAGQLVRQVARLVGGSGGGSPRTAQAGGQDAAKLPEALRAVPQIVAGMLGR